MKPRINTSPCFIAIGESHHDFSYIGLCDELLKSCEEKGLKVAVFSEFQSQADKISHEKENWLKRHSTTDGAVDNEPENSEFICRRVDDYLAKHNKLKGYYEHYHGIQESARISALQSEQKEVAALDSEAADFPLLEAAAKERGKENWGKIHSELMASRDGDYVERIRDSLEKDSSDVVILWTGGAHLKPVIDGVGISSDQVMAVSNQHSGKIGELSAVRFSVDAATKAVTLPESIEKELASRQSPKESEISKRWVEKFDHKTAEKKSWVERMRSDPTEGQSPKGSHEL